jgi:glyoxylate/hydroxypyruvate reductase A
VSFLFLGSADRSAILRSVFEAEAPDIAFHDRESTVDSADIRYLATWLLPADMERIYPNLDILFSTGAGADQFDLTTLPPKLSLVRLIEKSLITGMVEYVCGAVLALHRDFLSYGAAQRRGEWKERHVSIAHQRRIGILGAGELGRAVLDALSRFGFQLSAWSRNPRVIKGVIHHHGAAGLEAMLAETDILVCLLPLTAATTGILCCNIFNRLPDGAALINVGRGRHLVDSDLLDALASGKLSQAILDVVDPEPLPQGHPFWTHPQILLTPHIASVTEPVGAAREMIANIRRHRSGKPLVGLVGRDTGY